jgi:hypothetical protein
MGKGSKSYATPLAPWVSGAHKRLIREAEAEAYGRPYEGYGGERLAGFTPEEQAGFQARRDLFEGGDPYADWAAGQLQYGASLPGQLGDISPGYSGRSFDFGEFDQSAADKYMNPYVRNVLGFEKQAARDEFARQNIRSDAERTASGARGGYREALQGFLGGAEQAKAMAEIESRGMGRAYESAQQQFERDRVAAIEAARMGDASGLNAARMAMQADLANQQRVMDQAQMAGTFAQMGMDFGTIGQSREMQRIQAMEQSGATQRELEQAKMNMAVEDFQRQRDHPWAQMARLQGVVSGTPANIAGVQQYQQPANIMSQLLGLGIGYSGIKDLLGKG